MDENIRDRVYLKLYYSLLDWEWISDPNTLVVFIHLLLNANRKAKKFGKGVIRRGDVLASLSFLAEKTGLSVQNVRTALEHLQSTHDITQRMIGKNAVYSIVSYDKWQSANTNTNNEPTTNQHNGNKKITTNQQRANNESTTPIECKNEENEENVRMGECVEQTHTHGKFNNVILTDSQYNQFKAEYPFIADEIVDQLSLKIAADKKAYSDNHLAHLYIFAKHFNASKGNRNLDSYDASPSFDTSLAWKLSQRLDPEKVKRRSD